MSPLCVGEYLTTDIIPFIYFCHDKDNTHFFVKFSKTKDNRTSTCIKTYSGCKKGEANVSNFPNNFLLAQKKSTVKHLKYFGFVRYQKSFVAGFLSHSFPCRLPHVLLLLVALSVVGGGSMLSSCRRSSRLCSHRLS